MKKISIWKDTLKIKSQSKRLENNTKCDVLIIGGGITGLSTAYYLNDSSKNIVLIDRKKVGNGITSLSTGKLTVMQDIIYSKICKVLNYETAFKYYKSQKYALRLLDNVINSNNLDCDYSKSDSYVFAENIDSIASLKEEELFYKKAKIKYEVVDKLPNNYPIKYGLKIRNMHVFNPLKFLINLKSILKNVSIYENVNALSIERSCGIYKIKTNKGNIFAKKIVVSTHYPFFVSPGFVPFKTHIEKSYMLATRGFDYKFNAINSDSIVTSIRYYKDYMIMANNSHVTTDKDNYLENFDSVSLKYKNNFDNKIDYIWSNHDIMTNDNMPLIGEVSRNIYVATGYNKWGLLNGFLAGKILSDTILNKKNIYKSLFSFNRNGSSIKFLNAINSNLKTANTYIKMKLFKKNTFNIINEKDVIIYKDGNKEYKVYNKCPHMGCKLLFNELEKTWDCPCHGSRFNLSGKSIFGPSNYSISVSNFTKKKN